MSSTDPSPRARFARVVLPALAREKPRVLLEALTGPGSGPFLARLWHEASGAQPGAGLGARCVALGRDRWLAAVRLPVPAAPGEDAWAALAFRRRRGPAAWLGRRFETRAWTLEVVRDDARAAEGRLLAWEGPDAAPHPVAAGVGLDEASLRAAIGRPAGW